MKKKLALGLIVLSTLVTFHPAAAVAAGEDFATTVVEPSSCDQRAPRIEVMLTRKAQRVGYGYPNSDVIFWLDTGGVAAGTHQYTMRRQPFGSTREWVPVAAFKGEQGLYTAPMLSFTRPARAECVVQQNPRITSYGLDVNTMCEQDSNKMVIATLKVKRGIPGYIVAPGVTELVNKNDTELRSTAENTSFVGGTGGSRRMVEYYFFTGRRAQFKLDPSENGIWPVTTSSDSVELLASLEARCMPSVP